MNDKVREEAQNLDLGAPVHLYQLDASKIGGSIYHFTSATHNENVVQFGGVSYTPIEIEAEGFEWNGQGGLPTPTIRLGNVNKAINAIIRTTNDLRGATFVRIRTFERFLDGEPDADSAAHFPPDIYQIERKVKQSRLAVEFQLAAIIDQEGRKLPRRQVLRDYCQHTYRYWTGTDFDYSKATCPYALSPMYKADGTQTTNESEDACGKLLSHCRQRFQNQPLPFRGFPSVSRVR